MEATPDTTLLVLSSRTPEVRIASALQSAASALGHKDGCSIMDAHDVDDLKRLVFEIDPWSVIAIDDPSIAAINDAFAFDEGPLSADHPAEFAGYTFVAVPGFAECLDDPDEKRIAWGRMKSAAHPQNPLD